MSGLLQEALAVLVRAYEVAAPVHGANAEIVHTIRMPLASLLGTMRKFNEAIKLFREELAHTKAKYGATNPLVDPAHPEQSCKCPEHRSYLSSARQQESSSSTPVLSLCCAKCWCTSAESAARKTSTL